MTSRDHARESTVHICSRFFFHPFYHTQNFTHGRHGSLKGMRYCTAYSASESEFAFNLKSSQVWKSEVGNREPCAEPDHSIRTFSGATQKCCLFRGWNGSDRAAAGLRIQHGRDRPRNVVSFPLFKSQGKTAWIELSFKGNVIPVKYINYYCVYSWIQKFAHPSLYIKGVPCSMCFTCPERIYRYDVKTWFYLFFHRVKMPRYKKEQHFWSRFHVCVTKYKMTSMPFPSILISPRPCCDYWKTSHSDSAVMKHEHVKCSIRHIVVWVPWGK